MLKVTFKNVHSFLDRNINRFPNKNVERSLTQEFQLITNQFRLECFRMDCFLILKVIVRVSTMGWGCLSSPSRGGVKCIKFWE